MRGELFNVGQNEENYRVREIAAIVAAEFPGCEVTTGPSGGDNRSYRVNFDKIHRQLPGFRCHYTAKDGARQLHQLFERIGFDDSVYKFRAFTRLKQLQYLQKTKQVDARAVLALKMRFEPLGMDGAWLVVPEPAHDERGFFARTICVTEFASHGLNGAFVQSSISFNRRRGTFRGMHFQWPPSQEAKLVRCVRGSVCDILLDLRPGSPTFRRQVQVTLDDVARNAVYIPAGFAHGFLTLTDDAEVQYHMTDVFRPQLADGFRWDDPAFDIVLPEAVSVIAVRDANYPWFDLGRYQAKFAAGVAAPATA